MVDITLRNTDRVVELVDDLVTTASLELDQIEAAHRRTVPLGPILTSALDTIAPICLRHDQTLHRPHHLPTIELFADNAQLERALVNVLSNAAKYTPEGGDIRVTVTTANGGVAIAIADTGIGIAAHQLERLGEQFFRADTADDHAIKGIGLGLAVTKAVLAKHDGHLSVTSNPGHGSTFTLWLPLTTPDYFAGAAATVLRPAARHARLAHER